MKIFSLAWDKALVSLSFERLRWHLLKGTPIFGQQCFLDSTVYVGGKEKGRKDETRGLTFLNLAILGTAGYIIWPLLASS